MLFCISFRVRIIFKNSFIFLKGIYDIEKESGFRTKPQVLENIRQRVNKHTPSETQLLVTNEEKNEYPRNMEQIYKIKSRALQSRKSENNFDIPSEFIDIQKLLIDPGNKFIQEYYHRKGDAPSVLLYTDDQIDDLAYHVGYTDDLVIGIDRTFNMSSLYVTAISYKNSRLISNTTKTHPIKLGPIFLHKEATETQYSYFLSSIKGIYCNFIFLNSLRKSQVIILED